MAVLYNLSPEENGNIMVIFLNSFIEVELIYNVLVTGVQQTDSITHTHTHTHISTFFFQFPFP